MHPAICLRYVSLGLLLAFAGTAQAFEECQFNLSEPLVDLGLMSRLAQSDSAPELSGPPILSLLTQGLAAIEQLSSSRASSVF